MIQLSSKERQYIKETAAKYRKQGYEVIEKPSTEQLPDFFCGYRPDLIVRIGDYTKAVEVMTRQQESRESHSVNLARLLEDKPDWGHELIILGQVEWLNTPDGAASLDRDEVLQQMERAKELLGAKFPQEALLVSWAALEATVRMRNKFEGIAPDTLTAPAIFSVGVFHGTISGDDYSLLVDIMKYRNAVAHGFKLTEFDPAVVRKLNRTVKRLLPSVAAVERYAWRGPYKLPD